jgi:apolipoprotein N-acyltransferase
LSVGAFSPFHIFPLLAVSLPLALWLLQGAPSWKGALALGWAFGFGQFLLGLFWIAEAFSVREGFNYGEGMGAVFLLSAALAIYPALAFLATWRFARRGMAQVILFAVFWSLAEWLRGHMFTGFPWNIHAASLSAFPSLIQSVAWVGGYGLSLLVTLAASIPAAVLLWPGTKYMRQIVTLLAIPLVVWGFGLWRLEQHSIALREDISLILVQPGISQKDKWNPELIRRHFHQYIDSSTLAASHSHASKLLVLWPETAVAYPVGDQPGTRYLISKILDRPGYVITGAPRYERQDNGSYKAWNSIFAIDRFGNVAGQYDKFHLVPFGEYVPLKSLLSVLGIERIVEALADFSAGPGPRTLSLDGIPSFSPLICYEGIFPGSVKEDAQTRPDWLVNLSNDAWFGASAGPYQHYALARLRAVEEGLPLVRSTPTGISVVVDSLGREIARLDLGETGVLQSALPKSLGTETVYSRVNDLSFLLLLVGLVIIYFVQKLW